VSDVNSVMDLWTEEPPASPQISGADVTAFVRRNIVWILGVGLLASVAVFLAAYLVLNKYQATATIVVDPRNANVTQGAGVLANIGGDPIAIESIVQVAKTNNFLSALATRLKLAKNSDAAELEAAIESLQTGLSISRRGTTYVIDVTASNRSAEESARIANAAAQAIIDDQHALRSNVDDKTANDIDERLTGVRSRLDRAESAAAELKAELKLTDAGQGSTLLQRRVFELNQQRVLASARVAEAQARYEQLRRLQGNLDDNVELSSASAALNLLRSQRALLLRQSADQMTSLGPRHPAILALNAQIGEIDRQIVNELARTLRAAHTDLLEAQQAEAALARQLQDVQQESDSLGPKIVKLDELDREAKAERTVYEQLLTRRRELAGTQDLEPNDIHFVSPATTPTRLKPGMPVRLGIAGALGLLCGLAAAALRESAKPRAAPAVRPTAPPARPEKAKTRIAPATRARGERTGERLATFAGATVVGQAPRTTAADPGEGEAADLTPYMADLVAALHSRRAPGLGAVIMVASAHRGAGASSVAESLAAALAKGRDPALLIEAAPPARERGRRGLGLLDVLASQTELRRALVEYVDLRFKTLPFGGATVSRRAPVVDLIRSVKMRALVRLCRRSFAFVVIDAPPALEFDYARDLAELSDTLVYVAEPRDESPDATEDSEAIEWLGVADTVIFLNKWPVDAVASRARQPGLSA